MGLVFGREVNNYLLRDPTLYNLIEYVDSNFAEDPADQKAVMGYYFFLNRVVVSWNNKK